MKKLASFLFFVLLLCTIQFAQTNPPTNLTAQLNNLTIRLIVELTWEYGQSTAPVKFNVYKKDGAIADSGNFSNVFSGFVNAQKYIDADVQLGNTYSYYVTAVINGVESDPSNMVEISVVPPLTASGNICGVLFDDSTFAPIPNGIVQFLSGDPAGCPAQFVMTDSNGFFTTNLSIGNYFIHSSAEGYVSEYYDDVSTMILATIVTLGENDSLVFNIGLKKLVPPTPPILYSVTGGVKDQENVPQQSELRAYVTNRGHNFPSYTWINITRTDSLGNYEFRIKAGDTIIVFCAPLNPALKSEYWDNKFTFNEADKIPVNGNVTDINFILEPKPFYNNGISGSVKDSADVLPLKADVFAYKKLSAGNIGKRYFVETDSSTGNYSFINIEPGSYILSAASRGYKSTYFRYDGTPTMNWREADSIVVTETGMVANIDFRLRKFSNVPPGNAFIYGDIFENTGNVLDATMISIYNENNEFVGSTISELDGSYQISGLTIGSYTISSNMLNYHDMTVQNIVVTDLYGVIEVNISMVPEGVTEIGDNSIFASQFDLYQNYPNPFNPSTTISFTLPKEMNVKLVVYNILGQQVAQLLNRKMKAGSHVVNFDASKIPSGVYFYRLDAENYSAMKKMILQK